MFILSSLRPNSERKKIVTTFSKRLNYGAFSSRKAQGYPLIGNPSPFAIHGYSELFWLLDNPNFWYASNSPSTRAGSVFYEELRIKSFQLFFFNPPLTKLTVQKYTKPQFACVVTSQLTHSQGLLSTLKWVFVGCYTHHSSSVSIA